MATDSNSSQFSRRAFVLGMCSTALYGGLVGRLGWLQITNGDQYQTLSDNNRIHVNLMTPVRGYIMDRHGDMLAYNEQNFRVQIVPEQASDIRVSLDNLSNIIDLRPSEKEDVIKRAGGYVGAVSDKEMTDEPILRLPDFQIGKTGIERIFEQGLRGQAGSKSIEVNSAGRMVRELGERKGVIGQSVSLTIDKDLQSRVMKILSKEKSASAVVMDVVTGAVYACASYPSFDPNLFATRLPQKTWDALNNNPGKPLNNKAISGQYPPGSTFKMITALAALDGNHEGWSLIKIGNGDNLALNGIWAKRLMRRLDRGIS